MPSLARQVDDALVAKLKAFFGGALRTVEWAPAEWDLDYLKRILPSAPGVFVVFSGGASARPGSTEPALDATWSVVAVTAHAGGEKSRAHGDSTEIGAYDIAEMVIPLLHGFTVPGIGTLQFRDWDTGRSMDFEEARVMIHEVSFGLTLQLPRTIDPGALELFNTLHAQIDTEANDFDGVPEIEADIELPQT